jgi:hypothetical protein
MSLRMIAATIRGLTPLGLVYLVAPDNAILSISRARFRELANFEPQPGLRVVVTLEGQFVAGISR